MSLILTPPPTVMVFFKEISLKNESTGCDSRHACFYVSRNYVVRSLQGAAHSMHNDEKKIQVGKEISVSFYYFKRYCLLQMGDKKYLAELNKILTNKRTIG